MNYPRDERVALDVINQALYTNPGDAKSPHVLGKFREKYRVVNQVVHYNINPRGTENKPSNEEGEMLYAFMNPKFVCDWAKYIYGQMVDFKVYVALNTRMPFPCLVTKICLSQGVTSNKYASPELLGPGVINNTILMKSISQSKGPMNVPGGEYLTTMPPKGDKKASWWKKLFC